MTIHAIRIVIQDARRRSAPLAPDASDNVFTSTFDAKRNPDGSRRRPAIRPNDRPSRPPLRHRCVGPAAGFIPVQPAAGRRDRAACRLARAACSACATRSGAVWRRIVKIARLGPTEPEHEYRRASPGSSAASLWFCHSLGLPLVCRLWARSLPARLPPSRRSLQRPVTASAAASTSCAGGCRAR